jgi:hypothetical protein
VALTSDPHAWLRPFFARLQTHPAFRHFAPAHQFAQLVEAVAVDHPAQAAQMREWSPGAQHALLLHLASSISQTPPHVTSELWTVTKGARTLRCVAQYLSSGIDVRLLEGDGFRRTQLCRDAPEADTLAKQWRAALIEQGWQPPGTD